MLENHRGVYLKEDTHQYFDSKNINLLSVGKFLDTFKKEFNSKEQSLKSAIRQLKSSGIKNPTERQVSEKASLLKSEWKEKADMSNRIGNRIHNALELYDKERVILPENKHLTNAILSISKKYSKYEISFPEKILYYDEIDIAGTADKPMVRKGNVMDIVDYKTNAVKGIEFQSKYDGYFLGPIKHLEECNYNRYALQLSIYAHMLETTWKVKIGNLMIEFIPPMNPDQHYTIPVPYMKAEVENMIKYYIDNIWEPEKTTEITPGLIEEDHHNPFL